MELQEKKKNRTEQKTDMQNKEKALLTQLDEIAKQDRKSTRLNSSHAT